MIIIDLARTHDIRRRWQKSFIIVNLDMRFVLQKQISISTDMQNDSLWTKLPHFFRRAPSLIEHVVSISISKSKFFALMNIRAEIQFAFGIINRRNSRDISSIAIEDHRKFTDVEKKI